MQLPKLSAPPADFLTSMEAYVAEAPRPVAAEGEAPMPAKVGGWATQLLTGGFGAGGRAWLRWVLLPELPLQWTGRIVGGQVN